MSTLSLYQKRPRRGSSEGWKSWQTVSGVDLVDNAVGFYVVYSATLTLTNGQHLTGCQVATNFVRQSGGTNTNRTLTCYVYNYDPTGYTDPPSNYLASTSVTTLVPTYGIFQTFYFTGLDISTSGTLYFWFSDTVSGMSDYQYSYSTGNGYTGTPYASGTFSDAALSLSLSSAEVSTGGNQVVTIGNGSGRSCTVRVYYSNTLLYAASTSTGSLTIPVSKTWFTTAGLSAVTSFSVSVQIDEDSSLYESFTVKAGNDMKPSLTSMAASVKNSGNAAEYFPNTCIAGVSKYHLEVTVTLPTNATVRSVVISYAGGSNVEMTYNSSTGRYVGDTGILSSQVAISVTVTDTRGLTATITPVTANPVPYTNPTINVRSAYTYRCNSSGTQESGGAYWRAKAEAIYYTSLSGNSLLQFKVQIQGQTAVNLSSDVQTSPQGGSLNANTSYTLIFTIQDKVSDPITKTFRLESKRRGFVMKESSFGFGKSPELANTIDLPSWISTAIDGALTGGSGYHKHSDGTLIQWGSTTTSASGMTQIASSGIYYGQANIAFPIEFVGEPIVVGSTKYSTGHQVPAGFVGSTTGAYVHYYDFYQRSGSPLVIRWVAIGRWK